MLRAVIIGSAIWGLRAASAVAAGALGAHAATLGQVAGRVGAVQSDGSRYVAWQVVAGPVVLYDTRTGRQSDIGAPMGCGLGGEEPNQVGPEAAAGRFLLQCGKGEGLYDVRSGTVTLLPAGSEEGPWLRVGSHYVEGQGRHNCRQSRVEREDVLCRALYDIATGIVTFRPEHEWPDLDRAGAPSACPKLLRILLPESPATTEGEYQVARDAVYSDGLLATFGARRHQVKLERCGGHATILHCSCEPVDFDLGGGLLTWDTGHLASEYDYNEAYGIDVSHGRLWSYDLHSHRRQSWTLPRRPLVLNNGFPPRLGVFGWSTHTSNTVFWIAALELERGERDLIGAWAVYAAHV